MRAFTGLGYVSKSTKQSHETAYRYILVLGGINPFNGEWLSGIYDRTLYTLFTRFEPLSVWKLMRQCRNGYRCVTAFLSVGPQQALPRKSDRFDHKYNPHNKGSTNTLHIFPGRVTPTRLPVAALPFSRLKHTHFLSYQYYLRLSADC